MINKAQLEQMKNVDITKVDRNALVDVRSVHIDASLPGEQKMQSYLGQIKNPYCFRCGDTAVRISFAADGDNLQNILKRHFASVKGG